MTKKEKDFLLKLSRRTLEKYFKDKSILTIDEDSLEYPILKEKRGVFITLTKNGKLRGCIGNLIGDRPVFKAVIENTLAAALFDPRFPPVEEKELDEIKIEISLLSELTPLKNYKNVNELILYLKKTKPGLFLKKGHNQATFLPQVWKELEDPEEFLVQLCLKAGLDANCYKKEGVELWEYKVEKIQEEENK